MDRDPVCWEKLHTVAVVWINADHAGEVDGIHRREVVSPVDHDLSNSPCFVGSSFRKVECGLKDVGHVVTVDRNVWAQLLEIVLETLTMNHKL